MFSFLGVTRNDSSSSKTTESTVLIPKNPETIHQATQRVKKFKEEIENFSAIEIGYKKPLVYSHLDSMSVLFTRVHRKEKSINDIKDIIQLLKGGQNPNLGCYPNIADNRDSNVQYLFYYAPTEERAFLAPLLMSYGLTMQGVSKKYHEGNSKHPKTEKALLDLEEQEKKYRPLYENFNKLKLSLISTKNLLNVTDSRFFDITKDALNSTYEQAEITFNLFMAAQHEQRELLDKNPSIQGEAYFQTYVDRADWCKACMNYCQEKLLAYHIPERDISASLISSNPFTLPTTLRQRQRASHLQIANLDHKLSSSLQEFKK